MIKDFYKYLEGYGISDIVKIYTNIIFEKFDFKNFDFKISLFDKRLPLYKLNIVFKKQNNNNSNFIPTNYDLDNGYLCNIKIIIGYRDENVIKGLISHELTHLLEFYNRVKNRSLSGDIKISKSRKDTKMFDTVNQIFYKFRLNIYFTLDNELNARVSQIYQELVNHGEDNEIKLKKLIEKTDIWKISEDIKLFDVKSFVDDMIKDIGLKLFLKITNSTIVKLKEYNIDNSDLKKKVNNKLDLIKHYSVWKKMFDLKIDKHRKKLIKIIKEVSKDVKYWKEFGYEELNDSNSNKEYQTWLRKEKLKFLNNF